MKEFKSYLDYPPDTIEAQELIRKHLNVYGYIKGLQDINNESEK